MPLNPSIPLAAIGRQQPIDIITPVARGIQLKQLAQQQRLGELQLEEATRQQTEQRQLKEVFGRHAEAGTVGSQAYLREIGQISPTMFQTERKAQIERQKAAVALEKSVMDLQKADLDLQASRLQQAQEVNDYLASTIGTTTDQTSYERNIAAARQYFENAGLDTTQIDQLPELYDPQLLNEYRMQALSVKEQLDEAYRATEIQREQAKQQALQAGRVEEARQKAEATEPSRMRVAERRGVQAAERQAQAMVRAAEIQRTEKPLTGAEAKQVSELNAALEMSTDIAGLFKPEYVGQISGRVGAVREFTGQIADEEVQLRRVVSDVKDTLLRARSGAQINEREYARLSKLVPDTTDQPNVFMAKLRGFQRAIRQLRDEKLRVATTGRERLREEAAQPQKIMTEADVQDAMRQTGWARQDVLDAARQRGYQTPEQ